MAKLTKEKIKDFAGIKEITEWRSLLRRLFAEFIGTFLYLSIGSIASTNHPVSVVTRGLSNGLLLSSIIQMTAHISGGHVNPAVTLGFLVYGCIKPLPALCYIVSQAVGALAGSTVAYYATTFSGETFDTSRFIALRADQLFALEFLMSVILMSVVICVINSKEATRNGVGPIAIGLCLTGCLTAAGSYNVSLNPVNTLRPAMIVGTWRHYWVHWVGPLSGGIVAGLIYRFVFTVQHNEANNNIMDNE